MRKNFRHLFDQRIIQTILKFFVITSSLCKDNSFHLRTMAHERIRGFVKTFYEYVYRAF